MKTHFSNQENQIWYFNEKEFAAETWHLAEDSLAVALKCFIIRVSSRAVTWAFVSDSGAICRLKSTEVHIQGCGLMIREWGNRNFVLLPGKQLSLDKILNSDYVSFREESQYRCYPNFTFEDEQNWWSQTQPWLSSSRKSISGLWDILLWMKAAMDAGINPRIK